jgi:hypothetical protein
MKRALAACACVLLTMAVAFPAEAGAGSKISFNLGGSFVLPLNSGLTDNYRTGFHIGGTLNFALSPSLAIFVDGRFHSFGLKSPAYGYPAGAELTGGGETIFSLIGGVKYVFPSAGSIHFYVMGGIGLNMESIADLTARWTVVTSYYTATYSETTKFDSGAVFGIVLGPGLQIDLGTSLALFGELRYASAIGKSMYLPVVLGILVKL